MAETANGAKRICLTTRMTGSDLKEVFAEDGHALASKRIDQRVIFPAYTSETRQ
jgi:hypothetical protein